MSHVTPLDSPDAFPPDDSPAFETRRMDRQAWVSLGAGVGIALVCLAVPWPRFALSLLTTLVHELGHTVWAWLFGYPAIPAFDFRWGGGLTRFDSQKGWLVALVYLALAGLIAAHRKNRFALVAPVLGLCAYALCVHTDAHRVIILFMGHGTELVFAGLFLYRALSGSAVLHPAERPLYAACGAFIVLSDTVFALRLLTSATHRALYRNAKGGDVRMDFSLLATDYFGVEMTTVVFFFLVCCVLTVVLSYLAFRHHGRLSGLLGRLARRGTA